MQALATPLSSAIVHVQRGGALKREYPYPAVKAYSHQAKVNVEAPISTTSNCNVSFCKTYGTKKFKPRKL